MEEGHYVKFPRGGGVFTFYGDEVLGVAGWVFFTGEVDGCEGSFAKFTFYGVDFAACLGEAQDRWEGEVRCCLVRAVLLSESLDEFPNLRSFVVIKRPVVVISWERRQW